MGLSRYMHQRGTIAPNCWQTTSILRAEKYKSHAGLGSLNVHEIAVTPSELTSMNADRRDFYERTGQKKKTSIHSWIHFPLKSLGSELGIVFLISCPKDLDKVIEINSWEIIPTSTHLQKTAAP
jgi:hypothetical protein